MSYIVECALVLAETYDLSPNDQEIIASWTPDVIQTATTSARLNPE
jgi:hypothetical protein